MWSVAETLQPFANDDRERIIRWAWEKLGVVAIKKFVNEKAPKSDVHFAATLACNGKGGRGRRPARAVNTVGLSPSVARRGL